MKPYTSFLFLVFLLAGACKQKEKTVTAVVDQPGKFINPPIKGVDVPYKEYKVDAAKGDTLVHSTGSVLLFPPNSFVDEAGNVVTGNVQVRYREFVDPIDFYLAGIPMQYDSAGSSYQFESSGMMEILAYKDGKPVFVNQKSKPEIYLNSTSNSAGHSLYRLDTVQKKWINKGSMTIIELKEPEKSVEPSVSTINTEVEPPLKPLKADNNSPVLEIVIDPNSFKEFAVYQNMKFQVDESKTPYNVKDTSEEWNKLELVKANSKGSYLANFSNANKTSTYAVKPVFEGEDYTRALKVFEKEYAAYERKAKDRDSKAKDRENKEKARYESNSLQNRKIEEENKRIAKLNKQIEKSNKRIEKQNERIAKINQLVAERNFLIQKRYEAIILREKNEEKLSKTLSRISIDGFGFWNCDHPVLKNSVQISATFKDENGKILDLGSVAVIIKSFNGIIWTTAENITVVKGVDNMILAVYEGKLAYVTFEEFRKLNINADTKEQIFIMKVVSEQDNNYEYIKGLMKQ